MFVFTVHIHYLLGLEDFNNLDRWIVTGHDSEINPVALFNDFGLSPFTVIIGSGGPAINIFANSDISLFVGVVAFTLEKTPVLNWPIFIEFPGVGIGHDRFLCTVIVSEDQSSQKRFCITKEVEVPG